MFILVSYEFISVMKKAVVHMDQNENTIASNDNIENHSSDVTVK